ncbi:MAG: IPT/TIG domain-containing protein [Acidobacteria bacterium]|nr:IPT/TIG domain-containing protein [Acidobacteriota bacterium]
MSAQVAVRSLPPAALVESSRSVTLTAQMRGTLPGESTAVRWSLNDQPLANTASITFPLANAPPGVASILKATSVFDPTKFAAVPVIPLQQSELSSIGFPEAVAYHPTTGRIYVAALVSRGAAIDTNIVEISPNGGQSVVATLSSDVIDKLLPYVTSVGTPYLLTMGLVSGTVSALHLGTRTSRRIATGLGNPVSGAFHPVSGDLYIAEQNARRISVVSRAALDFAVAGNTMVPQPQPLPLTIPQVSGVSFLADHDSKKVSLLATATNGVLYKIDVDNQTFATVASGLSFSQEVLVLESAQLGLSFVLTASSTNVDGLGRVSVLMPLGSNEPYSPAYAMASALDIPTDLAFAPAGSPYSSKGKPVIVAANSSPTPSRGKVILWEIDPVAPSDFYVYNDRVQPSLSLISPSEGEVLTPGSAVEVRWRYVETNPLNPPNAHFPASAEIMVSTDGGSSFSSAGLSYIPSGPQENEYSQTWQVPADLAENAIRLQVQTRGLEDRLLTAASSSAFNVLAKSNGLPQALLLDPNFVVAGENAKVTVHGLNFQTGTVLDMGEGVSISATTGISPSRLLVDLKAEALTASGARKLVLCNGGQSCRETRDAFFVLPPDGPRISAAVPNSGSAGATVEITGNNFSGLAANNMVMFGNLTAPVSQAGPNKLVVQVPFGLNRARLSLSVQTNGIASNPVEFFLIPSGFLLPFVNRDGVVNGASFLPGTSPVAPGSIVSVFGANMASSIADAPSLPLPRQLLNTSVVIGGILAPLFFAAPNQINAQLPEEIAGLSSVPVTIVSRGIAGNTVSLNVVSQNPGIFSLDDSGKGPGKVLNQDGTRNDPASPERIGNTLQVFATGLGDTNPSVTTGASAPSEPLSHNINPPTATIDGVPAPVSFSGRSPGYVGLDQVNVVIPAGVSTGRPVPLVITAGPNSGNTVTVNVAP